MQGEMVHHHHHCAIAADTESQVSVEPNRSEKQEPLISIPNSMAVGFLAFFWFFVPGFVKKVQKKTEV